MDKETGPRDTGTVSLCLQSEAIALCTSPLQTESDAVMCVSSLTTSVKQGVKYRDIGNEIHRLASASGYSVAQTPGLPRPWYVSSVWCMYTHLACMLSGPLWAGHLPMATPTAHAFPTVQGLELSRM